MYMINFFGIGLIACSTISNFFLEVFKVLSLCGLKKDYYFEVKLFFPTILLYIKLYV